jgi:polysaccharide biosynthesis/export protein VpsN
MKTLRGLFFWGLTAGFVCPLIAGCALPGMQGNVATSGGPATDSRAAVPVLDIGSYRLAAGDKIRIQVYGEEELSIEAQIESTGTITYPLLGRVVVQGYTLRDVEQLLTRRLSDGYLVKPLVRVSMLQFRPIYVTGQVRRVGAYPYVEGLTVEKALALAGGMTEIASVRKIYILREGLRNLRERASLDAVVLPGDTILVDESLF